MKVLSDQPHGADFKLKYLLKYSTSKMGAQSLKLDRNVPGRDGPFNKRTLTMQEIPASSVGSRGTLGTPCRQSMGVDPPVAIRRGEGAHRKWCHELWCQRIYAFELWCWRRLLRVLWTARRSKQSILKEISPGCSIGRTYVEAKTPILWPPDAKS